MNPATRPLLFERPPTPPKVKDTTDAQVDEVLSFLDTSLTVKRDSSLNTPPSSSPRGPKPDYDALPSKKPAKRLRFELPVHHEWCSPSNASTHSTLQRHVLRPVTPSRSILKPRSAVHTPCTTGAPGRAAKPSLLQAQSLTEMLDSIFQKLSEHDRVSKSEAYIALSTYLKTNKGSPQTRTLRGKLSVLEDVMRKDIRDCRLMTDVAKRKLSCQAVKLTLLLLDDNTLARTLSHRYLDWLVEDTIDEIRFNRGSKESTGARLCLFNSPVFCKHIVSGYNDDQILAVRISPIVQALNNLSLPGPAEQVFALRNDVYLRLIQLARQPMLKCISVWLPTLLMSALHDPRAVSSKASEVILRISTLYGANKAAATAITSFMNATSSDGSRHFDSICQSLNQKLVNAHECSRVPRIWMAVVLFQRHEDVSFLAWSDFDAWLQIIKRCFNSSNRKLRYNALMQWGLFIRENKMYKWSSKRDIRWLCEPIFGELSRSAKDRTCKDAALSVFYVLLYHGFRPPQLGGPRQMKAVEDSSKSRGEQRYRLLWGECVHKFVSTVCLSDSECYQSAWKILNAFFVDGCCPGDWTADKHEPYTTRATDIPRLETSWIRRNSKSVLATMELLLQTEFERRAKNDPQDPLSSCALWENFLRAISDAGKKEITMSQEAKLSFVAIVNTVLRLLSGGHRSPDEAAPLGQLDTYLVSCWSLVGEALCGLNPQAFSGKTIYLNDGGHVYGIEPDISLRKDLQSPILVLLVRLVGAAPADDPIRLDSVDNLKILKRCVQTFSTLESRVRFLEDYAEVILCHPYLLVHDVDNVAQSFIEALKNQQTGAPPSAAGDKYRNILALLRHWALNINFLDWKLCEKQLDSVSATFFNHLERYELFSAFLLPLLEDLGRNLGLHEAPPELDFLCAVLIINQSNDVPKLPSESLQSIYRLWDIKSSTHSDEKQDWLSVVHGMINILLEHAYSYSHSIHSGSIQRFMLAIEDFTVSNANKVPDEFLQNIEQGLSFWITDTRRIPKDERLEESVLKLWQRLTSSIVASGHHDSSMLSKLEVLISAGFRSPNKAVVDVTIDVWNKTFGEQELLRYPAALQTVVSRLARHVDIQVPPNDQLITNHTAVRARGEEKEDDLSMFPWLAPAASSRNAETMDRSLDPPSSTRPMLPLDENVVEEESASALLHSRQRDEEELCQFQSPTHPSNLHVRLDDKVTGRNAVDGSLGKANEPVAQEHQDDQSDIIKEVVIDDDSSDESDNQSLGYTQNASQSVKKRTSESFLTERSSHETIPAHIAPRDRAAGKVGHMDKEKIESGLSSEASPSTGRNLLEHRAIVHSSPRSESNSTQETKIPNDKSLVVKLTRTTEIHIDSSLDKPEQTSVPPHATNDLNKNNSLSPTQFFQTSESAFPMEEETTLVEDSFYQPDVLGEPTALPKLDDEGHTHQSSPITTLISLSPSSPRIIYELSQSPDRSLRPMVVIDGPQYAKDEQNSSSSNDQAEDNEVDKQAAHTVAPTYNLRRRKRPSFKASDNTSQKRLRRSSRDHHAISPVHGSTKPQNAKLAKEHKTQSPPSRSSQQQGAGKRRSLVEGPSPASSLRSRKRKHEELSSSADLRYDNSGKDPTTDITSRKTRRSLRSSALPTSVSQRASGGTQSNDVNGASEQSTRRRSGRLQGQNAAPVDESQSSEHSQSHSKGPSDRDNPSHQTNDNRASSDSEKTPASLSKGKRQLRHTKSTKPSPATKSSSPKSTAAPEPTLSSNEPPVKRQRTADPTTAQHPHAQLTPRRGARQTTIVSSQSSTYSPTSQLFRNVMNKIAGAFDGLRQLSFGGGGERRELQLQEVEGAEERLRQEIKQTRARVSKE